MKIKIFNIFPNQADGLPEFTCSPREDLGNPG